MTDNILTVSQLNLYIKSLLDFDEFMSSAWVMGEVSNFKHHSSGHMYMTLKDESSSLKAVMFKTYADTLGFEPENGMKILAHGRVSVYERDGQYQLYIEDMQPYGAGTLYVAFEQLKLKLQQEGLFDEKYKKNIPAFPEKIAVITSPKGAAVHDIINVITRRYNLCDILICPVSVQGKESAVRIAGAIEYVNLKTDADLIIVGRGGGSAEDLQCFNEEIVARAIFDSKIPVISAVGHETDFTIADFVADVRAATPSVAAELATPVLSEVRLSFLSLKQRLENSVSSVIKEKEEALLEMHDKNILHKVSGVIEQKQQYICNVTEKVEKTIKDEFQKNRERFVLANEKLRILSPLNIISKGYSVTQKEDGNIVKKISDVNISDKLEIKVSDGIISAEVLGKEKNDG